MFSDFKGLDAQATKQLQILKSSNDVLGVMVSDIFEHKLQPTAEFYATDGAQQIALSKDAKDLSTRYEEYAKSELARPKASVYNPIRTLYSSFHRWQPYSRFSNVDEGKLGWRVITFFLTHWWS